jgi:hypothetical protein
MLTVILYGVGSIIDDKRPYGMNRLKCDIGKESRVYWSSIVAPSPSFLVALHSRVQCRPGVRRHLGLDSTWTPSSDNHHMLASAGVTVNRRL